MWLPGQAEIHLLRLRQRRERRLTIGFQGGMVFPFDLAGNVIGPGFQPFGAIPDTIDGLAFVAVESD